SGGEDNITVVLFSIAEGEEDPGADTAVSSDGRGTAEDLEDTLTGLEPPAGAGATRTALVEPGTAAEPAAVEEDWGVVSSDAEEPRRPPRVRRAATWTLVAVVLVLALFAAAFWGISRANFIGAEPD